MREVIYLSLYGIRKGCIVFNLLKKRPAAFSALLALAGVMVIAQSCDYHYERKPRNGQTDQSSNATGDQPTETWLISNVLGPKCALCHNSGNAKKGVNVTTHETLCNGSTSAGVPLITWGNAEASLIHSVTKSGYMPTGSNKLTPKELEILACWINKGEEAAKMLSACVDLASLTPTNTGDSGNNDDGDDGDDNDGDDNDDDDNDDDKPPPTPPPPPREIKFAEVSERIFKPFCIECHSETYDVNLESYSGLMGSPIKTVETTAEASKLYQSVKTNFMPFEAPALSDELKELLKNWIDGGAKP